MLLSICRERKKVLVRWRVLQVPGVLQTACESVCVCTALLRPDYNGMILSNARWICMKQEAGATWACRYVMCMQLDGGSICLAKQDTLLRAKMPTSNHLRFAARICKQGLENRHRNQPQLHWDLSSFWFENHNCKILTVPINMQKLFSCSFPWSPFSLLEGDKQCQSLCTLSSATLQSSGSFVETKKDSGSCQNCLRLKSICIY